MENPQSSSPAMEPTPSASADRPTLKVPLEPPQPEANPLGEIPLPLALSATPAQHSEGIVTGAEAADSQRTPGQVWGAVAGATTKEEFRAAAAESTALYVQELKEEIGALKQQLSDRANQLETSKREFHNSDKEVAVLDTKLKSAY